MNIDLLLYSLTVLYVPHKIIIVGSLGVRYRPVLTHCYRNKNFLKVVIVAIILTCFNALKYPLYYS